MRLVVINRSYLNFITHVWLVTAACTPPDDWLHALVFSFATLSVRSALAYDSVVKRPYGKIPRTAARGSRKRKQESDAFKIRIRGRDDAPLSMDELQQGLYEAARKLREAGGFRAKRVTIYLHPVDEHGEPVRINDADELTIRPYSSAADEAGI